MDNICDIICDTILTYFEGIELIHDIKEKEIFLKWFIDKGNGEKLLDTLELLCDENYSEKDRILLNLEVKLYFLKDSIENFKNGELLYPVLYHLTTLNTEINHNFKNNTYA